MAGRVRGHRQGTARWVGLGPSELLTSRSTSRDPVGGRSHARARGRNADPGPRHVRALVSARLRRLRGAVRRRVHAKHQLGARRAAASDPRAQRTGIRIPGVEVPSMTTATAVEQNTTKRRGVGLRAVNPERASPGFTLFAPLIWGDARGYLVYLHCYVVLTWSMPFHTGLSGYTMTTRTVL